ncbi:helix-turn-helix transcriptional regulator [Shewanella baltica]|uniref:helix-turn-helix domain-containing protein n=1 Tax=Shewanella TaxID=22 RepID=UPI0009556073|nr:MULTISPECIES: helix-turn-helix transcriptional regulator [Shewanella]MCS6260446.1 helix-turn-helix transcriptional regulator [Shewanella baltica]SIR43885.1 Helix-turn-helix [Shewanella morhuae]
MKKIWSDREEALRNELKAMRKMAGFNQSELAPKLGKPQSFVFKYESGERQLKILELEQVCLACGTTTHALLKNFSEQYAVTNV